MSWILWKLQANIYIFFLSENCETCQKKVSQSPLTSVNCLSQSKCGYNKLPLTSAKKENQQIFTAETLEPDKVWQNSNSLITTVTVVDSHSALNDINKTDVSRATSAMEINFFFFCTDAVNFSQSEAEERRRGRAEGGQATVHYTDKPTEHTIKPLLNLLYFIKNPQMKIMIFTLQSRHLSSLLHVCDR